MAKVKTVWVCNECGDKRFKWSGQCVQCEAWNSYTEEIEQPTVDKRFQSKCVPSSKPVRISEVSHEDTPRYSTKVKEFDRLIGGGIVPGSLTLVGGAPGIGKSTLLLQVASVIAQQNMKVLYVCGEESVEQTSMRARRLGITSDNVLLLNETNFGMIRNHIDNVQPQMVIIDSIQIVYKDELTSAPGSVSQVRETATEFMHLAKGLGIAIFLVGHVTKSGEIAGPRVLEHLVDTVLYFEGDRQQNYRMMRVVKNRFGPTDEIAVFQMQVNGLAEVPNPSQLFLEERAKQVVGSVITPTIEGTRPILIETQALVTDTVYSTPSRRCTGMDQNRLALLLAVMEKRAKYPLHNCDVFVSIAGGIRIKEPAIDLGVLLAVASSLKNQVVDPGTIVLGEIGLGGEVRSVPQIETRIKEAVHMGFTRCLIPKRNERGISQEIRKKIHIHGIEFAEEAIHAIID